MSDQIWLAIITTIGGVCLEYLRRIHKKVTACGDPECRKQISLVKLSDEPLKSPRPGMAAGISGDPGDNSG